MFESTVILSKPIKLVHWVEPEFPSDESANGDNQDVQPVNHGASPSGKSKVINEELWLRAQEIALKEAENQRLERIAQLLSKIDQSVKAHAEEVKEVLAQYENRMTLLSFAIAKKIVDAELKADPEIIIRTIGKALRTMNDEIRVEIQVNPADKETVEKYWQEMTSSDANRGKWNLEVNASIGIGGCLIKTPSGLIDARMESQLGLIESMLHESLNQEQETPDAA
jgi:flagellar biosynthesis/type III secretory pathway protein FliH